MDRIDQLLAAMRNANAQMPDILRELRRAGKLRPMSQAIKPPPRMNDPDYDDLLYIPGFEENPYT